MTSAFAAVQSMDLVKWGSRWKWFLGGVVLAATVGCAAPPDGGTAFALREGPSSAVRQLLSLADKGDPTAQFELGVMYSNRQGVPTDYAQAFKWFQMAADQGNAQAQYHLAAMYEEGLGVPQDFKLAVKWYKMAAEQGYAPAQYNLGAMYDDGRAIAEDDKQALKWYRRSARQGFAPAQHNLGSLYEQGHLVPRDDVRALMWYTLAALPSHEEDGKIDPDRVNALVAHMTPEQVETARTMARACEASNYNGCD
jgi:uncharacterized protein